MEEITYRKSTAEDLPQIIELLEKVRGDGQNMDKEDFLVAALRQKIIGCGRIKEMEDNSFELASVAVAEQFRNKGIGGKLVRMLIAQNKRRPIYLMCRKSRQNFYEKYGFREIEENELSSAVRKEFIPRRDRLAKLGIEGAAMRLRA
jgi:N-acetylglutamate synthase-like GNAT family acetyltransferase